MRITGGDLKGRIIKPLKSSNYRPTTDKTREAVFSILGAEIDDIGVADLFCGNGLFGIEALSRGASSSLFMDISASAISNLNKNLKTLGLLEKSSCKVMDVFKVNSKILEGIKVIFADPPYRMDYPAKLISLFSLQNFDWYGILALEHESAWRYNANEMQILKRAEFGDTAVTFLRKTG